MDYIQSAEKISNTLPAAQARRAEQLRKAQRTIITVETELLFTRGSQKSMSLPIEDVMTLVRIARRGSEIVAAARGLAHIAVEVEEGLNDVGMDQSPFSELALAIETFNSVDNEI